MHYERYELELDGNKIKSIIEAVLFTMGDPVEPEMIAEAIGTDKKEVRDLICELMQEYESEKRGIRIIEIDGSYQMCTSQEAYEYLIKLVKIPKNYKLTDVQLEVLSIIAYKQPVTKPEIEKIRGVQSDHAVNRLIEAGLVEEAGRLDQPGRPVIFVTTQEFLRRFGIRNTQDLPDIQEEQKESFKLEAEQELGYINDTDRKDNDGAVINADTNEDAGK